MYDNIALHNQSNFHPLVGWAVMQPTRAEAALPAGSPLNSKDAIRDGGKVCTAECSAAAYNSMDVDHVSSIIPMIRSIATVSI